MKVQKLVVGRGRTSFFRVPRSTATTKPRSNNYEC